MAEIPGPLVALTGYFQSWARDGLSTADIWDTLRALETEGSVDLEGVTGAHVSAARGAAGALNRNEDELAALAPGESIGNVAIPVAPWARPPTQRALAPQWQVRVVQDYLDAEGNPAQAIRTIVARGDLPATAADLADFAATEGEALILSGSQDTASAQLGVSVLGVFEV